MSEKLCELKKKGGGGGGKVVETVLWTNPSPSSNFSAQTVTLSDSISNYDYIKFVYGLSTSIAGGNSVVIPVSDFKQAVYPQVNNMPIYELGAYNTTTTVVRGVMYASDTTVRFSPANNIAQTGSADNRAIPTAIIGIKNIGGIRTNEKYDTLPFQSVNGGAIPVFSTKGTAKAIWLTYAFTSSQYRALQITNVNPYTGEIDNNSLYRIDTSSVGTYSQVSNNAFVVTNGSVTLTNDLSSTALKMSLVYTY